MNNSIAVAPRDEHKDIGKMEVMFKLQPPVKSIAEGRYCYRSITHIHFDQLSSSYVYIIGRGRV